MINWWLIGFLVFLGSSWVITLFRSINKDKLEGVITLIILAAILGVMYMAGIFTNLWGVYR